jgi:hypothetical protein
LVVHAPGSLTWRFQLVTASCVSQRRSPLPFDPLKPAFQREVGRDPFFPAQNGEFRRRKPHDREVGERGASPVKLRAVEFFRLDPVAISPWARAAY